MAISLSNEKQLLNIRIVTGITYVLIEWPLLPYRHADSLVPSPFLNSLAYIEALGLVLVLSFVIWRHMERAMRMSLKERETTMTGWEKRQTANATSFMMTATFLSVVVLRTSLGRFLGDTFDDVQLAYLKALGMTPEIFTNPFL